MTETRDSRPKATPGSHDQHPTAVDDPRFRVIALTTAGIVGAWAAFQVALAAGAPFGEHVWGGTQPATLPTGMRVVSGGAALLLIWMLTVILARADLIRVKPVPTGWLRRCTWAIAGYMALGTLGNLASQSTTEQRIFAPITLSLAVLTAWVAHRGRRN